MNDTWMLGRFEQIGLTVQGVEEAWQCAYVIHFYNCGEPVVVYVGSGNLAERIQAHRCDMRFDPFKDNVLLVTWVCCPGVHKEVERFLAGELKPIVGEAHPNVRPLPIELPFRVGFAHYLEAELDATRRRMASLR